MGTQITLDLSDEVYQRASRLAALTGQSVREVLGNTLEQFLSAIDLSSDIAVTQMTDAEVLKLSESMMDDDLSERTSVLLDRQQAGLITEAERIELIGLMQVYDIGLLRKAQALAEAVRRGLRPPLES